MKVVVCIKHAPRRVSVDPLTAEVRVDPHDIGLSAADESALELALQLSGADDVTAVTAGPVAAEESLRAAAAIGASILVRCPGPADAGSRQVAAALAEVSAGADLVLCGDYSSDRGSGSVPGFIAAALGAAQALGVVSLERSDDGLLAQRRLDRGRREVLRVPSPAVVSVEGGVARLRRASIRGLVDSGQAAIALGPAVSDAVHRPLRPHRPRVQLRTPPPAEASPFERIQAVTQATSSRTPPRLLTLDPPQAADAILDQLRTWGYLPELD